jgi:hypothetical protein
MIFGLSQLHYPTVQLAAEIESLINQTLLRAVEKDKQKR